jgi:ubiquitin C-terminal hydrolase
MYSSPRPYATDFGYPTAMVSTYQYYFSPHYSARVPAPYEGGRVYNGYVHGESAARSPLLPTVQQTVYYRPHQCFGPEYSPYAPRRASYTHSDAPHDRVSRELPSFPSYSSMSSLYEDVNGSLPRLPPPLSSPVEEMRHPNGTGAPSLLDEPRCRQSSCLIGFTNLGNTCFLNAVLQCLLNTPALFQYLLGDARRFASQKASDGFVDALIAIVQSIDRFEGRTTFAKIQPITPATLHAKVSRRLSVFERYKQHDAHEALRYILDCLSEELNPNQSIPSYAEFKDDDNESDVMVAQRVWDSWQRINSSFIQDLFCGQLKNTLICSKCGTQSRTFDPFLDISLPIPKTGEATVHDCLSLLFQEEHLSGLNSSFCARCKVSGASSKRLSIFRLPRILVLHLKRFTNTGRKINVFVRYPRDPAVLDLTPFMDKQSGKENVSFQLYAVINHYGDATMGHYTAVCKHDALGRWYEYNDADVAEIHADKVVSPSAYILFFKLLHTIRSY